MPEVPAVIRPSQPTGEGVLKPTDVNWPLVILLSIAVIGLLYGDAIGKLGDNV